MKEKGIECGSVDYSSRAFHQDAADAMRGDIVRGFIELVTNSDDSYARMEELSSAGKIRVEVEHRRKRPWFVRVRDRATGIGDLRASIICLGGRTSGFEKGENQRGNFGRGAKDLAAFGEVRFKTIVDDRLRHLTLHSDGNYELFSERDASKDDREDLGISRGNGTVVEVSVSENIVCPRHDTLKYRLSTHFTLRDIMKDPNRRVELVNLNDGTIDLLSYQEPLNTEAYKEQVEIEGFPDATAVLRIAKLEVHGTEGPEDPSRPHGILIKGQRAIYENTLFSLEGNVHAGWFAGEFRCPYIDQLAREYDDRFERGEEPLPRNPVPIISRRRDGLNRAHPFYDVMRAAIEEALKRLVAEEAERARKEAQSIENEDTRAALDRLAREAGRLINEELRDIEADELPETEGEGLPPLLSLVPEQGYAYMGEDRTLTCAARREGLDVGARIQIELDPGGVAELLTSEIELREHRRREDVLVGQVRLRPLVQGEATIVTARIDDRVAHAIVEVRPERVVIEEEIPPPEDLEFERPSYRVGWQKQKSLIIQAPVTKVAEEGSTVLVSSSDPGIVVRTPQVDLKYDEEVDFFRATIIVDARQLGATAEVRAKLGDTIAATHVAVTRKEEAPGLKFELVDEDFGYWRAIAEDKTGLAGEEIRVVKIAGRHPALGPILGPEWKNQNTTLCRAVIAEIVSDMVARLVVEELYRLRRGLEDFDSARFYREHYRRTTKFLPRFQTLSIGDLSRQGQEDEDEVEATLNFQSTRKPAGSPSSA